MWAVDSVDNEKMQIFVDDRLVWEKPRSVGTDCVSNGWLSYGAGGDFPINWSVHMGPLMSFVARIIMDHANQMRTPPPLSFMRAMLTSRPPARLSYPGPRASPTRLSTSAVSLSKWLVERGQGVWG